MSSSVRIIVESGSNRGQAVDIDSPVLTVGRQDGNDIIFDDPRVSRSHLRIELSSDIPYLTDLGSANGTFVNGQRLEGVRSLRHGDVIDFGDSRLRIEVRPEASTAVRASGVPPGVLANVPYLVLQNGENAGAEFPLDRGVLTVGRHESNNIVLGDRQASRHHARLYIRDGALSLSDLGSAHGTRVNGQPVHGALLLRAGDLIQIGTSLLKVQMPQVAADLAPLRARPTAAVDVGPGGEVSAGENAYRDQVRPAPALAPAPPWSRPAGFPVTAVGAATPAAPRPALPSRGARGRLIGSIAAAGLVATLCVILAVSAVLIRQRGGIATPAAGSSTVVAPAVNGSPVTTRPSGSGGANPAPPGPGAVPTPTPSGAGRSPALYDDPSPRATGATRGGEGVAGLAARSRGSHQPREA